VGENLIEIAPTWVANAIVEKRTGGKMAFNQKGLRQVTMEPGEKGVKDSPGR